MTGSFIGDHPPDDMYREGFEIDCMCARCGSSVEWQECEDGDCVDGLSGHDCGEDCCCCAEPEDNVVCQFCEGRGGRLWCISSPKWCEANPLQGRSSIKRGEIEWFALKER